MTIRCLDTCDGFAFTEAKALEAGVHRTHKEEGKRSKRKDGKEEKVEISKARRHRERGAVGRGRTSSQDEGGIELGLGG